MTDFKSNSEFESDSLISLESYLNTLHLLNESIITSSIQNCRKQLEEFIQVFSYAIEVFKSFLIIDEKSADEKNNIESFSSIVFRFIESMKILNDSFFMSLTGRYQISTLLERVVIESTVRGLFYYGASVNDLSRYAHAKRNEINKFLTFIQEIKMEYPTASSAQLEDYATIRLKKSEIPHAGLKQLLRKLHEWKLILQDYQDIDDFLSTFNLTYRNLSGFIHTAFDTTYTYAEKSTPLSALRVFWGAQFSKELLEKEIVEGIACVDLLLDLNLSALPSGYISRDGILHMKYIQKRFSFLEDRLVLSYSSAQRIVSQHK